MLSRFFLVQVMIHQINQAPFESNHGDDDDDNYDDDDNDDGDDAQHQGERTFHQVKNPLKSFDDW